MATSSSSLSLHSGSSLSPSSSSSSFSSLFSESSHTRTRTPPRRGQIKAAIFTSLFTSIARLPGAKAANESASGAANSQDERSSGRTSVDLEGGDFGHSVRSSSASNVSGRGGSGSASLAESPFSTPFRTPAVEMRALKG